MRSCEKGTVVIGSSGEAHKRERWAALVCTFALALTGLGVVAPMAQARPAPTAADLVTTSSATVTAPPAPHPYSQTFALHSDPGAPRIIYLDFVGFSSATETDSPYDLDGDPTTFSNAEQDVIQDVWARVSENYSAFEVDVTTQDPGPEALLASSGPTSGVRVDITNGGSGDLATACTGTCAGLSFTGGWGQFDPAAAVFAQQFSAGDTGNPQEIAEIASHEVGHSLGLGHDQTSATTTLWSALMTPAYQAAPLMQWTSTAAAGIQGGDELAIIEQTLTPKDDRYGQSAADAAPLAGTTFDFSGTVAASTQTDWFSFTVPNGAGPLNLEVAPSQYTSMLDLDATLFDSSLNVVEDSNPPATFVSSAVATGLDAPFSGLSLSPGTYYLRVQGSGGAGYSRYGSLGSYTVSGGFTAAAPCAPGSYSSTGNAPCTLAPVGSFASGPGATSAALCLPGSFSDSPGAAACVFAPAGSFASGPGATSAALCFPGSFSDSDGASACTTTPAGSFDAGTGNTSATACPAGTSSPAGAAVCTGTTTAVSYTGANQVAAGSTLSLTALVTSSAPSCQSGQPVTFSLSVNPLNGSAAAYVLGTVNSSPTGVVTGAAVNTTGWQNGAYMLTASYPGATVGATVCPPATTTASLAVTTPGRLAFGAGFYAVPGVGPTSFGFVTALVPRTRSYVGALTVTTAGRWLFQANVTGYSKTNTGQGLLIGKGALYWWNPTLNRKRGGWQLAQSGVAYKATANAATRTSPASFGISISYTPVSSQPTVLPNSSPIALSRGSIVIS